MKKVDKPLVYAIVGPTSSGKSEYAVQLAKKIGGEILSVDSRQIYRGMDIGTGKIPFKTAVHKMNDRSFYGQVIYKNIKHYGIDIASPKRQYSVAQFQTYAKKVIVDMLARGKTPILCGGTMHWLDVVLYNQQLPDIKPNAKLRHRLQKKSVDELFAMLKKLDPARAKNIDTKNPRRLIRALEIVLTTGKPVPKPKQSSPYAIIWIGLKPDEKILHQKIEKRLRQRLKAGMIAEVKRLHDKEKLSWHRLESFGLEYKYCSLFLQGQIDKQELFDQLASAIKKYAKRQMTWWKRNGDIKWINRK